MFFLPIVFTKCSVHPFITFIFKFYKLVTEAPLSPTRFSLWDEKRQRLRRLLGREKESKEAICFFLSDYLMISYNIIWSIWYDRIPIAYANDTYHDSHWVHTSQQGSAWEDYYDYNTQEKSKSHKSHVIHRFRFDFCVCDIFVSGFGAHECHRCHTCPTCPVTPGARRQPGNRAATGNGNPGPPWKMVGCWGWYVVYVVGCLQKFDSQLSLCRLCLLTFCIGSLPSPGFSQNFVLRLHGEF